MSFHEDYHDLVAMLTEHYYMRWQNQLPGLREEDVAELQEARRHISHLAVLFTKGRRLARPLPSGPVLNEIVRRGSLLREIILKHAAFFDIDHGAYYNVVETILRRDKQLPVEDRVARLWGIAEPVLGRLRFPSPLDLIAQAALDQPEDAP